MIYGLTQGKGPLGRALTRRDLESDSPYNTYRRHGLPPTPIACPGIEALRAVIAPHVHDELYFVASGDGGHRFAKTLEDHNKNVRLWRNLKKSTSPMRPIKNSKQYEQTR